VQDGTPPADKNFQQFNTSNFRSIKMLRKLWWQFSNRKGSW